jgi:hypothetical protein
MERGKRISARFEPCDSLAFWFRKLTSARTLQTLEEGIARF